MEPRVHGSTAKVRLDAYQQRLQMEAESVFSQIKWRSVGPEIQGGRVIDFESPKDEPGQLFVAYATGGLWKSTDQGNNWKPIFDGQSAYAIGDVAINHDGKTIWVGTGENNSQRTSYSGTGVFKSTDGGTSWQNMGLAETHRIGQIVIDSRNENNVWVAAVGSLYSVNPERGVYKTTDGGKTWTKSLFVDEITGAIDLVMDPRDSNVLYASTWDRDRRAWNFREGGPGSAIYKTVNAGKTWTKLTGGLPTDNLGRIGLAIAPSKPDLIYAFMDNQGGDPDTVYTDEFLPGGTLTAKRYRLIPTEEIFTGIDHKVLEKFFESYLPSDLKLDDALAQMKDKKMTLADLDRAMLKKNADVFNNTLAQAQVWRSEDAGKTWHKANPRRIGEHGGYYGGRITVDPKDPNSIYITGVLELHSPDGGNTFEVVAGGDVHVDFHVYWIDPRNPNFHVVGSDGGLYFSFDKGQTWRHVNNVSVGQFTTIAVDNKVPYNIYGGLQDNGTMRGPSNYRPGQSDLFLWKDIGGGDGSAVVVDPRDDGDVVYVASQFGAHSALNQKTNARWNVRPAGGQRFNWVSPIIISTFHPDILYIGSNKVHRSFDQGRHWEAISPDLTKNLPNGDVPFSTIKDISESPLKFGVIYAGCDDGNVQVTKDGGVTWEAIPTPAPDKWVSRIVASKYDKGTVYCSQSGYRQDDWTAYLWKSTDYGKTWTSIVGNLPAETINVIREDPEHEGMLFVGTDMGVFVSYDGGGHWEALAGALPHTPVHDLVIQPREKDLVIASHARSVYVLNLKAVYDADAELRKKDIFIWPIDDMSRSSRWGYQRREEWNVKPPTSPVVKGSFWSSSGGKGFVRIKDKDGKVAKEIAVTASKGYNFFEISLETKAGLVLSADPKKRVIKTPEDAIADPFASERPEYLLAGDYKIEVEVGGKKAEISWKLGSPSASLSGADRERVIDPDRGLPLFEWDRLRIR